jgi:hypothetical protein
MNKIIAKRRKKKRREKKREEQEGKRIRRWPSGKRIGPFYGTDKYNPLKMLASRKENRFRMGYLL